MDVKTIERNIVREQDIHPQINYSGKKLSLLQRNLSNTTSQDDQNTEET